MARRRSSRCGVLVALALTVFVAYPSVVTAAPEITGACTQGVQADGDRWYVSTNKSSYTYFRLVWGDTYYNWQRGNKIADYRYTEFYGYGYYGRVVAEQAKVEDSTGWAIRQIGHWDTTQTEPVCG